MRQDWAPFVLVAGLLVIGLVAQRDGLFHAAGGLLSVGASPRALVVRAGALVAVVTALLNLDTAVVFLTPVLLAAARRRGHDEVACLYLAVLMANAASLLLPGANLTNLIVVHGHPVTGLAFAARMWPAWLAACAVVLAVVLVWLRPRPVGAPPSGAGGEGRVTALAMAAVGAAGMAVVLLPAGVAAPLVLAVGLGAAAARGARRQLGRADVAEVLDLAVLTGLFALAVALGTLGRVWSGPATALGHLGGAGAAAAGAVLSVLCNNLPAASLLAARPVPHPYSLLVGLDLGPNLAVTGALSAVLWLGAARRAGARPSATRYSLLGLVVVPLSMAAALLALAVGT